MAKVPTAFFGKDTGGVFGGKIARPGIDVFTAGPLDLLFTTERSVLALAEQGTLTVPPNTSGGLVGQYLFTKDYGYIPFVLVTNTASPLGVVFSNFAAFAAIYPGPSFIQQYGFVTNVQSDRLLIRNIYNDVSQTFGISVFYRRTA